MASLTKYNDALVVATALAYSYSSEAWFMGTHVMYDSAGFYVVVWCDPCSDRAASRCDMQASGVRISYRPAASPPSDARGSDEHGS